MPSVSLNASRNSFGIRDYDGCDSKRHIFTAEPQLLGVIKGWNFFRQGDNHAYVYGEATFTNCRNTFLVSPYQTNKLTDVRNAFVVIGKGVIEIGPIGDFDYALHQCRRMVQGNIIYNTPKAVIARETLGNKDLDKLKAEIEKRYHMRVSSISPINPNLTRNGIYLLEDTTNTRYVIKFRGRDKHRAELLPRLLVEAAPYFPLDLPRADNGEFTFRIDDELYGLEEFIEGANNVPRDRNYFSMLGKHIGLLHNLLSKSLISNRMLATELSPSGTMFSESNILSWYLDLTLASESGLPLIPELEKAIDNSFFMQTRTLPKALIHGDLNHSNIIWQGQLPRFIDSEMLSFSIRIREFESPLLFGGYMTPPVYKEGNLETLINSYNAVSNNPLTHDEISSLPILLRCCFLRNYIVRKIRRHSRDNAYLTRTLNGLKKLPATLK